MQQTMPRVSGPRRREHTNDPDLRTERQHTLEAAMAALEPATREAVAPILARWTGASSAPEVLPSSGMVGAPVLTAPVPPRELTLLARALLSAEDVHFADLFADYADHAVPPASLAAGQAEAAQLQVHLLVALDRGRGWADLVAPLPLQNAVLESVVETLPAFDWYERELSDEAGVAPAGHPFTRRLRLPASWPEHVYPVRRTPEELLATINGDEAEESAEARLPLRGLDDDEREVLDPGPEGVVDYPLGPVRSGVVESGHYTLRTVGEEIVDFRLQLFYKHRGVEQRALGLGPIQLPLVAERISGTSGFAHALATCEALEHAAGISVPDRARYLRTFFAELERLYNHLGYQADLCQATGLVVGQAQFDLLKEQILRLNGRLTGHRYLFGTCVYGGVAANPTAERLDETRALVSAVRRRLRRLGRMLFDSPSHVDRLENTGILSTDEARAWATVGPVARASGIDRDLRRDHPYAAYGELAFDVPVLQDGDALARARVRLEETTQTLRLLEQVLEKLPGGPVRAAAIEEPRGSSALGWVESPRGEGLHWVRLDDAGRVARYRVRTASFANAQAFPLCIPGRNILTDFPVIEQSWALSYAGADR